MDSLQKIAEKVGVSDLEAKQEELSFATALILKIQSDGSTFFMKVDGERESNVATIMIEGGLLGDDYIRCETDDIQKGINQVIAEYSEKFWS